MWVGISVLIWGVVLGIAVLALLALSFRAVVAPGSLHLKPFLSGFQYVYYVFCGLSMAVGLGVFLYIPIADYFGIPVLLVGGSVVKTISILMLGAMTFASIMFVFWLVVPWSKKESYVFGFAGRTIIMWALLFLPWVWIQGQEAIEWANPEKYEVVHYEFTKRPPGLVDLVIGSVGSVIVAACYTLFFVVFAGLSLVICFPLSRPLFGLTLMNQSVLAASIYYVLFLGGGCAIIWYFIWPDLVQYYGGPYAWLNQYL